MPRDQETTGEPVPAGTPAGPWPADTTATGPDDTTTTSGGAFADRDVASAGDRDGASLADTASLDDTAARDGDGVSGTATSASSVPAPEGEWVAGSRGVPPASGAAPGRGAGPDLGAAPDVGAPPDLGAGPAMDADPDLDPAPDAAATQGTTPATATTATSGADTTRLDQPAVGAHAAPSAGTPGSDVGAGAAFEAAGAALLPDADSYRATWVRIQSGFVDDPRGSVTEAAELVTQITATLVSAVQERERALRGAWDGSGDTDTEDLRNALRDYRSFFERLIGV